MFPAEINSHKVVIQAVCKSLVNDKLIAIESLKDFFTQSKEIIDFEY